jgi:hypothetical protein
LAYAQPVESPPPPAAADAAAAAAALAARNPLIVVQRYGAGNVLLLNFDRTWRFRYRVGDTYHHQFWSQVLRWATANKLAGGTPHVRLATDRLRYQAEEPVTVRAQLLDAQANAVSSSEISANVYHDDRLVLKKTLEAVPDSQGMYQGNLGPLRNPGRYRVELEGSPLAALLALDQAEPVKSELLVSPLPQTSELAELSANWKLATQMAELTHGKAVGPDRAGDLLEVFGAGTKETREMKYISLWDSWLLLALILAAVSAEWILRRKAGLV